MGPRISASLSRQSRVQCVDDVALIVDVGVPCRSLDFQSWNTPGRLDAATRPTSGPLASLHAIIDQGMTCAGNAACAPLRIYGTRIGMPPAARGTGGADPPFSLLWSTAKLRALRACDVWLKCRSVDLEHHLPSRCARTCGRVDTWRMLEEGMQRGRRTEDLTTYEWQGRSRAALHYEGARGSASGDDADREAN